MFSVLYSAVLPLLTGCQQTMIENDSGISAAAGEVVLTFRYDTDISTRSSLNSAYVDYRTVQDVCILVFSGTGSDAAFLFREDIDWQGAISQTHKFKRALESGSYMLLAFGIDDAAGATYRLLEEITPGTPLKTIEATLAATAGAPDMARSDFYTAQAEVTVNPATVNAVEMTLKRRVSGVLVYLKNIPYMVGYNRVQQVYVKLYDDQRTSLLLYSNENEEDFGMTDESMDQYLKYFYGFGTLPDSRTLMEFDMTSYWRADDGNYFVIPAGNNPETLENTLFGGVFLLPLEAPLSNQTHTLVIELYGGGGTGILPDVLKTYNVKLKQGNSKIANYSVECNQLYSIGKKMMSENTENDKPADLSGNITEVYASEYDFDYSGTADFPTVSTPAYINDLTFNPEKYIFNCISTTETFSIDASYPSNPWTLTVSVDWIHIVRRDVAGNITGYTSELQGNGPQTVELLINDYVVEREGYDINAIRNDYRTAQITLSTSGKDQTVTLPIRQYNAVTIHGVHTDFGLSRLDYGCYFDRQTGEAVRPDTAKLSWGYTGSARLVVYGSGYNEEETQRNGVYCHERALANARNDIYPGSLLQKTRIPAVEITNDAGTNAADGKIWFTPAYHQLHDFTRNYSAVDLRSLQIETNGYYWTSTMQGLTGLEYSSYVVKPGSAGDLIAMPNEYAYPVRQARYFNE